MNAPTFAVLLEPTSELNLADAAAAMSRALGGVALDHAQKLRDAPGILARGLSEAQARGCVNALRERGMGAFALEESRMAVPPEAEEVRDGRIEEKGFLFKGPRSAGMAPWSQIIFVDCARVRRHVQREEKQPRTRPGWMRDYRLGGRSSGRPMFVETGGKPAPPRKKTVTEWKELLDVFCYEPWAHLRIDREEFRYANAGMPLHPTNHLNFTALLVMIKARAEKAACGEGVGLLLDGKPTTRATVASMEAYDNSLLWRLQLLWR